MQLPVLFGKYELQKFLGGGMSQVYKATDTVLGRTVAVKVLTDEGCRDDDIKKRFLLEARMSGSMIHDNIIRIHDYGEIDGRPFIVMEFLVGEDLRHAIDGNRTGDLKQKLGIAIQMARSLGFVHSKSIIHRDIKPENVHIDENGRVRLMDFGIAKTQNLNITREGFAIGTPYYMSPEQVLGKPVTGAVDIYAFGILLYELATGLKPIMGESVESLFYQILHQPLNMEPLQQVGVPEEFINLISRCAAKKPEERPSSFEVVISELEAILRKLAGGGSARAPVPDPAPAPAAPTVPKKNLMPFFAVGGALLLAAATIGYVAIPEKKQDRKKDVIGKKDPVGPPETILDEQGGTMILIPAGSFLSGPPGNSQAKNLPAFYIDRTEVSVEEWNKYAQATGKPVRTEAADLPVTNITFDEAGEFAAWAKKRLPTADEWEKAARGNSGRTYPWGNEPEMERANVKGNTTLVPGRLQPVNAMPQSATPNGILNMAGNAWEWVSDDRKPLPETLKVFSGPPWNASAGEPWTAARGGGFDYDIRAAVTYEFNTVPKRLKHPAFGFRCVRSVNQ
ncbi:MAG TPA: bifunctional serine/threonine-protein kinase/formylglycine-generating enzyme family protein [Bryobacteraceae bacterium]|nr:bifunctional serine/threonine-protein kinase/formylglycine-generating enzyme family protein [Bryobacteraceae bacterium]